MTESLAVLPSITAEPLEALAPEWASLWGRVPGATPFTHPGWQAARLAAQEGDRPGLANEVFLAVRREDELIGVAALELDGRVARQLGDPEVTDYAFPLALPGEEEAVAAGIVEWLLEDLTRGLDLWGVPEDSPMRHAFQIAAERFGWSYDEELEAVCPRVELPGELETYIASLSKHERHEVRRKLRHLEAAGEVRFVSVIGSGISERMELFLELMRMSREDKEEFLTAQHERLFRELGSRLGELEMARLGALELDGREIAMVFSFEDETATYLYNSGYDPEYGRLAAGLLSKVYAIGDAIERDKRVFDFLRGDEEYKRHLGGSPRNVLRLRLRG